MMTPVEAAALLRQQDNILILTHRRPDGDTMGSAAGLCAALRGMGKQVWILCNEDVTELNAVYAEPYWTDTVAENHFLVSVDVASRNMFAPSMERWIDRIALVIDHHGSPKDFGTHHCVYPQYAACGEIVYEICCALGEITPAVALPLYGAVATDTGCFVYANTTANTHRVAAELLESGIDYYPVNQRHFRTKSKKRLALESALLGNMEYFHEGCGAFLTLPLELIDRLGAEERDMEDLSALATIAEGVDCGGLLRELKPNEWKLSLRTGANGRVNAAEACSLLDGGGHAMAAGATIYGTLEQVREQVLSAIDRVKKF